MILSGFSVFDFGNFNCRQAGIIIDVHQKAIPGVCEGWLTLVLVDEILKGI
jgi:hypothetical protein